MGGPVGWGQFVFLPTVSCFGTVNEIPNLCCFTDWFPRVCSKMNEKKVVSALFFEDIVRFRVNYQLQTLHYQLSDYLSDDGSQGDHRERFYWEIYSSNILYILFLE